MAIGRFNDFDSSDESNTNEKMTQAGQDYVSKKIAKLRGEGKGPKQAAAIAYSYAKRKGYKVPNKNESLVENSGQVESFKEEVTKLFMTYKDKFSIKDGNEILMWLGDKSTVKFFSDLLLKESDNPLNDEATPTLDITEMTSLQFYKLIDLLEADIEAYGQEDIQYYEEMTGIDTGTLLDLYVAYGFNNHKYVETEKLKNAYVKKTGKTWDQIKKEAEEAE